MNPFRKQIRSFNGYAVFAYGFNTKAPIYAVETHVPGGHGTILHSFSGTHGRENAYKRFRDYSQGRRFLRFFGAPIITDHQGRLL